MNAVRGCLQAQLRVGWRMDKRRLEGNIAHGVVARFSGRGRRTGRKRVERVNGHYGSVRATGVVTGLARSGPDVLQRVSCIDDEKERRGKDREGREAVFDAIRETKGWESFMAGMMRLE